MRVLMTGAGGFIGRYVQAAFIQQGVDFVVAGRRIVPGVSPENFIEADLLTEQDFPALIKRARATHLLHLPWYSEHGKYWTSPLNLRWVDATVRLVEAFCEHGGQVVVAAGTCAEYDWTTGYCREDDSPKDPTTLYGVAKDVTRRLIMEICRNHQVRCAWGRIFFPYGPGEPPEKLTSLLIEVFKGRREPFGINAAAYRDYLHVSDVAMGFLTLLKREAHGVYNISSGEPLRLGDLAAKVAMLLQRDARHVLALAPSARKGDPHMVVGACEKLKSLGWTPCVGLEQGLGAMLELDRLQAP